MQQLIEGRCKKCGRLLFKFGMGTFGLIEVKCWASRCKELNQFQVESRTREWAMAST